MTGNPNQGIFLIEGAGQVPLVSVTEAGTRVAELLLNANGFGPRAYTRVRRIVSGIVELAGTWAVGGQETIQAGYVTRGFTGHSTRTWSAVPGTVVETGGPGPAVGGQVCAWLLKREAGDLIIVMPTTYALEAIGTVMSSMIQGPFTLVRFESGTVRTTAGIAAPGTKVVVAPHVD